MKKIIFIWGLGLLFFISQISHADTGGKVNVCAVYLGSFNLQRFVQPKSSVESALKPIQFQQEKISSRVEILANAISTLGETKRGVDFLGVVEIGSQELMNSLLDHPKLKRLDYQTAIVSGRPDQRGLDVGFISKFPLVEKPISHVYWSPVSPLWINATTRVILEATLQLPNKENLKVFMNHWAGEDGGDWSVARRLAAAKFLKRHTANILRKTPDANILIMGDFNSNPWGPEILAEMEVQSVPRNSDLIDHKRLYNLDSTINDYNFEIAKFKRLNPSATQKDLKAFIERLEIQHGTYYSKSQNRWLAPDQMIVSGALLKKYIMGSYRPVKVAPFINSEGMPNEYNEKLDTGVSNHVPVLGGFTIR